MKRKVLGLFLLIAAAVMLPVAASAASVEDLMFDAATGTITGCSRDAEGELVIPAEIDGVRVTGIGDFAFDGCSGLTSINLPDSLTSIGEGAFRYCNALVSIIIPDSVKSISMMAFENCKSLENIILPDTDIEVYASSFRYCAYFNNDDNWENGVLYIGNHLIWGNEDVESVTVKNGTKTIADYAFEQCRELTSVVIPDGVLRIGKLAFSDCNKLEKITIPDSVAVIDDSAFSYCYNLTKITLPKSIKKIELNTFISCSNLKSIFIPAGVTAIGDGAFSECDSLTDIYYEGTKDDWEQIVIENDEWGNYILYDATIHFGSPVSTPKPTPTAEPIIPLEVEMVEPVIDRETKTVIITVTVVDPSRAEELNEVELFVAEYDENRRFIGLTLGTKSAVDDDTVTITADIPETANYKFMLWDGNNFPLMDAVSSIQ